MDLEMDLEMDLWMMWHEFVRKTKLELWMSSKNYYRAQFRYQGSKLARMVQEKLLWNCPTEEINRLLKTRGYDN